MIVVNKIRTFNQKARGLILSPKDAEILICTKCNLPARECDGSDRCKRYRTEMEKLKNGKKRIRKNYNTV